MNSIDLARRVIAMESDALRALSDRLDDSFTLAITLLQSTLDQRGKIVVVGVGKSGNIGYKIAATLNSTGATAVVLNSQNALHGDLGLLSDGDAVIALSYSGETAELLHLLPSTEVTDYSNFNAPQTGKSFTGFKEAIAFKESQGQFKLINSLGYMGKYQFGIAALRTIGINNTTAFLNNPGLQEIAFVVLLAKNKWELKDEIEKYDGKVIKGIKITESGILAAAHLGGAGSVKKFLKNKGNRSIKDNYGTSLKSYLKKYGGYDTSFIIADNDANVKNK